MHMEITGRYFLQLDLMRDGRLECLTPGEVERLTDDAWKKLTQAMRDAYELEACRYGKRIRLDDVLL